MNTLFWLTNLVIAFTAYQVGRFVTIRNLRIAADKLMGKMEIDRQRIKLAQARNATQALKDNATGSPIGVSLARETGIEL